MPNQEYLPSSYVQPMQPPHFPQYPVYIPPSQELQHQNSSIQGYIYPIQEPKNYPINPYPHFNIAAPPRNKHRINLEDSFPVPNFAVRNQYDYKMKTRMMKLLMAVLMLGMPENLGTLIDPLNVQIF